MSILSIVAARKGSKGFKNKVVQKINGKYVFEYSVKYSLNLSNLIDDRIVTVVSSDSDTIKKYCLDNDILFIDRDNSLALDITKIEDVMYDAYLRLNQRFKYISLVYGNIPTRYPYEFRKAFDFLEENTDYDAVLSVQNVEKYNPAWMFRFNEDILPEKQEESYRRQGLDQFMIHDGHTILIRTDYFVPFMIKKQTSNILFESFGRKIKPLVNSEMIIDIDTARDLKLAGAALSVEETADTSVCRELDL